MLSMIDPNIEQYCLQHSTEDSDLLKALVAETYQKMEAPHMISGPIIGHLLKLLVSLTQAKTILEIGMFTGYSALHMASACGVDARIITCDTDPKAEKIARKYFAASEFGYKIEIKMGPALETIRHLQIPLDFIFIDADKENYFNYYSAVLPLLKEGGMMVFDNALRGGRVLDPIEAGPKAVDQVNKAIIQNSNLENILLTLRDGVNVVRKVKSTYLK